MIRSMKTALLLTAGACCSWRARPRPPSSPRPSPAPATSPPASATARSPCASWTRSGGPRRCAARREPLQALYDGRRAALENIIADMLLAEEAKKKGMSADAYVESEIAKRVKPVTDAEVVTFYQSNMNQMQGRSLEQMSPAINRFLSDQQRDDGAGSPDRRAARRPARRFACRWIAPRQSVTAGVHRSRARSRLGAGDAGGVLRLPVSVLPARRTDAEAAAAEATATSCGSCGRTSR